MLHVVRYRPERLDELVDEINGSGYGLTLGVHTRIDSTAKAVAQRARVGNVYVNRNMIGAVVGVQPFGGMGLSGHGAEGRRAALPAAVRDRAHGHDQHGRRRRQRDAAVARRRAGPVASPFRASAGAKCPQTVQTRVVCYAEPANLLGFSTWHARLLSRKRAGSVAVVT